MVAKGARARLRSLDLVSLSLTLLLTRFQHHLCAQPTDQQADAYRLAGDDRQLYIMLMRFARFGKVE